jgi:hypothetical protein
LPKWVVCVWYRSACCVGGPKPETIFSLVCSNGWWRCVYRYHNRWRLRADSVGNGRRRR